MNITSKAEILELLRMPQAEYLSSIAPEAREVHRQAGGNRLTATAMLGYSNICKNQCLYCGMRAANSTVPRYRLTPEAVLEALKAAHSKGFRRVFLISGEDPKYGFDNLLRMVSGAKALGMEWVSLACGEFEKSQYEALHAAGADEYVIKFEMSDPATFDRLNPSTSFSQRMNAIETVQAVGMRLASGNIVDYPGQTLEQLADDILLMQKLDISWAPIIPYMPAQNTPLALEGGPGSLELIWKEISILRLMMPRVNITAQQPGPDLSQGLASAVGNLAALNAGANFLYADLLPAARAADFHVIDNRIIPGLDHIADMARRSGMELAFSLRHGPAGPADSL